MLIFKPGVSLRGLVPQMLVALEVVKDAYAKAGIDCCVTSVNDSIHSTNSYHYLGRGLDFRTKTLAGGATGFVKSIALVLNPIGFDVLLEDAGGENEHMHVELDKGRAGY